MNHDCLSRRLHPRDPQRLVKSIAMVGASPGQCAAELFCLQIYGGARLRHDPGQSRSRRQEPARQALCRVPCRYRPPCRLWSIFFRNSSQIRPVVDEALKLVPFAESDLDAAWAGVNDEAAAKAEAAGLKVVMNRCPKIEYGRLSSEISWMGVNSRTLSSKRAPMPTQGMRLSLNRSSLGGAETAASDRAAKKQIRSFLTRLRKRLFCKRVGRSTIIRTGSNALDDGRM